MEKLRLNEKAQKILDAGGIESIEDEDLIEYANSLACSDGFWYALTDGGYLKIRDIVADTQQAAMLEEALSRLYVLQSVYETIVPEM